MHLGQRPLLLVQALLAPAYFVVPLLLLRLLLHVALFGNALCRSYPHLRNPLSLCSLQLGLGLASWELSRFDFIHKHVDCALHLLLRLALRLQHLPEPNELALLHLPVLVKVYLSEQSHHSLALLWCIFESSFYLVHLNASIVVQIESAKE